MDFDKKDVLKKYIEDLKRKRYINNYYIGKIKKGKSTEADFLDGFFLRIIIFIGTIIILYAETGYFIFSIVVSVQITILFSLLIYNFKNKKMKKKIAQINEELVKKKILKDINNLSSNEFKEYIKDILEEYYNTTFFEYSNHLDYLFTVDNEIWGVSCLKKSQDDRIGLKDINGFMEELKKTEASRGLIVTNSYFTEELKEKGYIHIKLVDFDEIIEIIKKIGKLPKKEEIEEIIVNKRKEKLSKRVNMKEQFFSKHNILRFFFLGIILILMSNLTRYTKYYTVVGGICIALSIISGSYNLYFFIKNHDFNLQK